MIVVEISKNKGKLSLAGGKLVNIVMSRTKVVNARVIHSMQ
jgi:hypothetical protein